MPRTILTPGQQISQRYRQLEVAAPCGNVAVACECCGISRKTYYEWHKSFAEARNDRHAICPQ